MASMSYSESLQDPRWQKKRLAILSRSDFHCEYCGDSTSTLHVHHKHYLKNHDVWDYEDSQLAALCKICHEEQHIREQRFFSLIAKIPIDGPMNIDEIHAILAGILNEDVDLDGEHESYLWRVGRFIYENIYG